MTRFVMMLSLFAVVVVAAATLVVYPSLPDPMPTHFDFFGEADGFSSKPFGAWFMPALAAAVWVYGALTRRAGLGVAMSATSTFTAAVHVLILRAALDGSMKLGGGLALLLGAFNVVLGLIFPRLRRNRWVGIRLPWTLSSDENWNRAHRFGGAVFFFGGLLTLVCAALLGDVRTPAALSILLGMTAIVSFASYRMSRSEHV